MNGAYSTTEAGESRALQANLDKVDIYSNSWGGADGTTFTGPSRNVNDAISNGIRNVSQKQILVTSGDGHLESTGESKQWRPPWPSG